MYLNLTNITRNESNLLLKLSKLVGSINSYVETIKLF